MVEHSDDSALENLRARIQHHLKVVEGEIEVLSLRGSKRELTDLMLKELEEMFISSDSNPDKVYHFKFNFSQE